MLPTLNLQLSPVEQPEGTFPASPPLLAGSDAGVEVAFADLLRLRVGTASSPENAGGGSLPQGGNDLPAPGDTAADVFLPTDFATGILPDGASLTGLPDTGGVADAAQAEEIPDVVLEAPVIYPTAAPATMPALEPPVLPASVTALPGVPATRAATDTTVADAVASGRLPDSAYADGRLERSANARAQAAATTVAAQAAEAGPLRSIGDRPDAALAGLGIRERGHVPEPPTRAAALSLAQSLRDSSERLPLPELPKPPGLATVTSRDGQPEPGLDSLQPRPASPLPGQASVAQTAMQFSQVPLSPASPAAAAIDVTYTGTTQQTGDLLGTSVRDSAWGSQLNERVVMMANNQLKSAEIRLTPAELGPLRVQVAVDDGTAHVTFHAQHAVTREAIEQALPRLREMLAENGLSLGQADVSDRGVGEGNRDSDSENQGSELTAEDTNVAVTERDGQAPRSRTISNGMVDTFA